MFQNPVRTRGCNGLVNAASQRQRTRLDRHQLMSNLPSWNIRHPNTHTHTRWFCPSPAGQTVGFLWIRVTLAPDFFTFHQELEAI